MYGWNYFKIFYQYHYAHFQGVFLNMYGWNYFQIFYLYLYTHFQGVFFPCIHHLFALWSPASEKSSLLSFVMSGE